MKLFEKKTMAEKLRQGKFHENPILSEQILRLLKGLKG